MFKYIADAYTHIHTLLYIYIGYEPPPASHSRGAGRRREDRAV